MKLDLAFCVFRREFVTLTRRRLFYWKRTALVLLCGLIILFGFLIGAASRTSTVGLAIFMPVSFVTLVAMVFIAPNLALACVVREKTDRTLGLLFLTDITGWQFVLGKLLTGMFSTVLLLLSVLPLFLLVASLGGVSPGQILSAFSILLGAILLGSSQGIFAGCVMRTERGSEKLLGWVWLLYWIFLPMGLGIISGIWSIHFDWSAWPGSMISPFLAMTNLSEGSNISGGFLSLTASVLLALPLLWISKSVVLRLVTEKEKEASQVASQEGISLAKGERKIRFSFWWRKARPWVTPPPIIGNPILWKDYQFFYNGKWATWIKCGVFLGSVSTICLGIFYAMREDLHLDDMVVGLLITLFFCSALGLGLISVNNFGLMFNRERKSRAIEVLLTTDLTDQEIIWGKVGAALLAVLPWGLMAAISGVGLILRFITEASFWVAVPVFVSEAIAMWFGFSCLAMWLSLRYKKSIAMGVCILVWIGWNTIGRILMSMGMMFSLIFMGPFAFLAMDLIFHIGMGVLFLLLVIQSFRSMALRDPG